jgi:hypothetical protein
MDYAARAEQLASKIDTPYTDDADLSGDEALRLAEVYAQLEIAHQAKRIADALEGAHDRPERGRDGRYRLNTDLEDM